MSRKIVRKKIVRKTCVLCGNVRRTTQQNEDPYTCRECEQRITRQFMKVMQGEVIAAVTDGVMIMDDFRFRKDYTKTPWWFFWKGE